MYVDGNPINSIDPSGNITEAESSRADDIVKELKIYRVYVKVDWGLVYQRPYINQVGVRNCDWVVGEWHLKELENLRRGVIDLARVMRLNNFIYNLGFVNVLKVRTTHQATGDRNILKVTNANHDLSTWTTVHELGHSWDANFGWRLSTGLEAITTQYGPQYEPHTGPIIDCSKDTSKKLPGCNKAGYSYGGIPAAGSDENFTAVEDFAESVAAYVYPDAAYKSVKGFNTPRLGGYLYYPDYRMTLRWRYINALIYSTNQNRPR